MSLSREEHDGMVALTEASTELAELAQKLHTAVLQKQERASEKGGRILFLRPDSEPPLLVPMVCRR